MSNPVESATTRVAPDLLKTLGILSDTTASRSAVDQEDLKTCEKSEKRSHFSWVSGSLLFTSSSKTLLTTERKLGVVVLSRKPCPNILKYRDHRWDLPTIWKTRFFQPHIEEFSYYVWKFRFTAPSVSQNHQWNIIRTRRLWEIKVIFDLFNQLLG